LYRPDKRFRPYPSKFVDIRNIQRDTFAVINGEKIIEEIEVHRAAFEIYEGAIFIHQGRSYLVQECNIDKRYAKVHSTNVDWITTQRDYTDVDAVNTDETRHISNSSNFVCFGQVKGNIT
jgi:DEAD/DEAH box helicase domain-containing protein